MNCKVECFSKSITTAQSPIYPVSKILERAVVTIYCTMSHHELFKPLQSGFRAHHSTETARIKIINDLIAADNGLVSILILLTLSTAFDTVSHAILLSHLHEYSALTDSARSWCHSYLSSRKQYIIIKDNFTPAPS